MQKFNSIQEAIDHLDTLEEQDLNMQIKHVLKTKFEDPIDCVVDLIYFTADQELRLHFELKYKGEELTGGEMVSNAPVNMIEVPLAMLLKEFKKIVSVIDTKAEDVE